MFEGVQSLKLVLIMLCLSSCSAKYGVYLGGHKADYNEEAEFSTFSSSGRLPEIELEGKGFHLGIYEESDWILTKIGFFSSSYDDTNYSLSGDTYLLSLKDQGLEVSLGPKLKWFYPHLIYLKHNSEFKVDGVLSEDDSDSLGYGVEFRFPVGDNLKVRGGYRYSQKTGFAVIGSGITSADISHSSLYVGLSYELFSVGGP